MISFLSKLFLKENRKCYSSPNVRRTYGAICSLTGVGLNTLLFIGKIIVGALSGSIAITADAINNLSDAGSSIITLIGFKIAAKKPDPHHPFGHGRIEYISALIVSFIILLMGFELGKASIDKILNPAPIQSAVSTYLILIASILVKLYMYSYNKKYGKCINSTSLGATSLDSLCDCIATGAALVSILVFEFTNINIDGFAGLLVAGFILFSGITAARDTIKPLLGQKPEAAFVDSVISIVMANNDIIGIHDLIVHDYGPGRVMLSLHAEVSADKDMITLHDSIDNVERELSSKLNCHAVIHMDPITINDPYTNELKEAVTQIISDYSSELSIHDFRVVTGPTHTNVVFDVIVPYSFMVADSIVKNDLTIRIQQALTGNIFVVIEIDHPYL